jgi:hypothetical protein
MTKDIVTENDPNFKSSTKVKRCVYGMISSYKEMLLEKQLQATGTTLAVP